MGASEAECGDGTCHNTICAVSGSRASTGLGGMVEFLSRGLENVGISKCKAQVFLAAFSNPVSAAAAQSDQRSERQST